MNNSPEGAQGSANSKTPKTDAFLDDWDGWVIPDPMRDFARQLERQLAQSEERVAKLEGAIRGLFALEQHGFLVRKNITDCAPEWDQARALLSSSKTN